MFTKNSWVLCVAVLVHTQISEACNGYSLKLNHVRNCVDDGVLKVEKGGATLDKDCNLILSGCIISKGFKTAQGKYTIKKAPMPPMEGNLDFCESPTGAANDQLEKLSKMYGIAKGCPVKAGKICGSPDKKISLSKYKNQLGIAAGTVDVKIEAEHENGKSCFEINMTLSKARARG